MKTEDFPKRFTDFISRKDLFGIKEPVLLAVSGGVDSVVLCRLFSLAGFQFGIAHCNFQLRGKDSEKDEQFVAALALQLKVPCFTKQFNTQEIASEKGVSIEMAARDLRYHWLEEIRKANHYHRIATAHHRDDSIETVLLNLVKGTGINGLHGILPKREKIIRPMLPFGKDEILNFAGDQKLDFMQDHTNLESIYQRNILRNKVIPELKTINPDFSETFSRNIEKFSDAEVIYKKGLHHLKRKMAEKRGEEWYIPVKKLLLFEEGKTILFEILKDFGFNEKQVDQIYGNINAEAGKQFLSEKFRVIKDRDFLIIADKAEEESGVVLIENVRKSVKIQDGSLDFHLIQGSKFSEDAGNSVAFSDHSKLQFPLVLRKWKKGDHFYPLGLGKKKKLSDFLNDIKLSIPEREKAWVLLSGEKIVWVVGYRVDDRFKVSENTKETLKLKWRKN